MIGTWIDQLSDERKDRLIQAQLWTYDQPIDRLEFMQHGTTERRCMVLHTYDLAVVRSHTISVGVSAEERALRDSESIRFREVPYRFDKLCAKHGMDRIVRLVKQRAGAKLEMLDGDGDHIGARDVLSEAMQASGAACA